MRFEIRHDIDAPLEQIEGLIASSELAPAIAARLPKVESMEVVELAREGGRLRRVTHTQARSLLPLLDRFDVARESMQWDEVFTYDPAERVAIYRVEPLERFRERVDCGGVYRLEPLSARRTRRVVEVRFEVRVAVLGSAIERLASAEVRAHYDAEAALHAEHARASGGARNDATVPRAT